MACHARTVMQWFVLFGLLCVVMGCTATPPDAPGAGVLTGKFAPPTGRTLFIIGQDNDTITDYLAAVDLPAPGGVTGYTSLERLEGLASAADYGAGTIHLDAAANQNPDSALILGLYLVDYLDEINDGEVDDRIDRLLMLLAGYERPVYLRFGYEFDGNWNHYDPEAFVAAWVRFYDRMMAQNVTNVAMVWQSATACVGRYTNAPLDAWYPGDHYVDWVGVSWFTQADCNYQPIGEMVAFAREHNKPVMIAEAAPQQYDTAEQTHSTSGRSFKSMSAAQIWDAWYAPFFNYIDTNQDTIRAVAYINTDWDNQAMWGSPYRNGYWGDSRVQANDLILDRWQTQLSEEAWLHGSPDLFSTLNRQ